MALAQRDGTAIAIVGLGCLFPGSTDVEGFWRDVVSGRDQVRDVPPSHWLKEDYLAADPRGADQVYCARGAFLDPVPFAPLEHALPPAALPSTDTSQLLALLVARRVLDPLLGQSSRDRVSVILGVASATELVVEMAGRIQRPIWIKAMREAGLPEARVQAVADRIAASYAPWTETTFPGFLGNVVAGRIANRLDLSGTNSVLDAACASSLAALDMAVMELALGRSDVVLTGGVDTLNDILMFMAFSKTGALSRSGDVRPFSDRADGTVLGEGVGMLALKRLADAERNGDAIYAVIRGVGASSDGQAKSVYAPRAEGQAKALRRAYAAAGFGPDAVELVEAHGTGTPAGDAAEFEALTAVFREADASRRQWCALGSIKSQIGHTKAASGAAGLIKAVLALHHQILPPTIKVEAPNAQLDLAGSPFYLNTAARPWIHADGVPRRAAVSSFGFGGSNFHVALEEYRGPGRRPPRMPVGSHLFLLSAGSETALAEACGALAATDLAAGFAAAARRSQLAFRADDPCRLAVVAMDADDLAAKLTAAGRFGAPAAGVLYASGPADPGRVALLFPGQGSQYVGMGAGLAMAFEPARAAWDMAAGLEMDAGARLDQVVFPPPAFREEERRSQAERLTRTEWAQPAIGAASLAALAVARAAGLHADLLGGHSFGELTALCAAGALTPPALLRLARRRGEAMSRSEDPGAMTSVAAGAERVAAWMAEAGDNLALANINAPEQVVVSGPVAEVERLERALAAARVRFTRLSVSTAFHSSLMRPAAAAFAGDLAGAELRQPQAQVHACRDGSPYAGSVEDLRGRLAAQIAEPVDFRAQVEALYAGGARTFVEVGPGAVLTGLVGQCLAGRPHLAVSLDRRGQDGLASFWLGLGRLALAGVPVEPARLLPEVVEAPARPSGMTVAISGVNYGRPYPPAGGASALPAPNAGGMEPDAGGGTAAAAARPSVVQPAAQPRTEAPVPAQAGAAAPGSADVLGAFQELTRQAADAQSAFERTLAESHGLFLKAAEASLHLLASLTGVPAPAAMAEPSREPAAVPAAPPVAVPAEVAGVGPQPPGTAQAGAMTPTPAAAGVTAASHPPVAAPAGARPESSARLPTAGPALVDILLAVVSDKTGYPPDMLGLDLDLEAELGIDSIKRVEILAALQERIPSLPPVEPSQLATLNTLGKVLAFTETALPPSPSPPLRDTLLAVVSEKTGYPPDMLGLDLDLEAELGIDSIKRVEILAALQERIPSLPPVEPAQLAALNTLGKVLAFAAGTPDHTPEPSREAPARGARPGAARAQAPQSARFVVETRAVPASGFAMPGLRDPGLRLAITDDGAGVADALAARLTAAGLAVQVVAEVPADVAGVILLDGLREVTDGESADTLSRGAFLSARRAAARMTAGGGVFVTVQDTGGDFGLSARDGPRAHLAGLAALTKTAAREWPLAAVKALDVERAGRDAADLAEVIAAELLAGGPELEVGRPADGRRLTLVMREAEPEAADPVLGPGAVIVATGGARGVTAACLRALAAELRPRLAILGRTALAEEPAELRAIPDEAGLVAALHKTEPSLAPAEVRGRVAAILAAREVRANLAGLRGAGADVRYLAADVRDEAAVARAIADVRAAWGPVDAVIHGAGVIADKSIAEKTPAQFEAVYGTKVAGLRALLAATREDPLRLLCLFSSVAARTGNAGQADYAMANEVLNRIAAAEAARRGDACRVRAIGWGPWAGGMVTPALQRHFGARGVGLLDLAEGCRRFVAEVAAPGAPEVVIAAGSFDAAEDRTWTMEAAVAADTHPYLADHAIRDVPVLPVVLALEWFVRAAVSCRPDLPLAAVEDLTVLRGIPLEGYGHTATRLRVRARGPAAGPTARLQLELLDAEGRARYRAVARMEPPATPALIPVAEPAGGAAWPWPAGTVYDGKLFHGPSFRVIADLLAVSPVGGSALLHGTERAGWRDGVWRTDPALLDGGLQVARLWGIWSLGAATLPTSIAAYVPGRASSPEAPVRCVMRSQTIGEHQTRSDISFLGPDGEVLADMRGVEQTRVPE